tara:strand:+ start:6364 stop:6570 length:207 start_codon:yes stop_codon:yes gene_type:complete
MVTKYSKNYYELMAINVTHSREQWFLLCQIHGEFIHINKNNETGYYNKSGPKCPDCPTIKSKVLGSIN